MNGGHFRRRVATTAMLRSLVMRSICHDIESSLSLTGVVQRGVTCEYWW